MFKIPYPTVSSLPNQTSIRFSRQVAIHWIRWVLSYFEVMVKYIEIWIYCKWYRYFTI